MNNIFILRTSYWAAAIADFIIAAMVLIPELGGSDKYVLPMGLMSAAAFSWGILLIIADRKPVERRWVLIPTMIVVLLLGAATFISLLFITIELWQMIFTATLGTIVFSLLCISHVRFRNTNK